jgi:hypothetical protein
MIPATCRPGLCPWSSDFFALDDGGVVYVHKRRIIAVNL